MSLSFPKNASVGDACNTLQTCDECIKTYTCHFCEFDLQCHTIGSTSGCIKGMSTCHHIEDCVRPHPQLVGYGPPMYVVLGVLCLVATLLCCCCGCSVMWGMIKRLRARSSRRRTFKPKQDDNDSMTSLLSSVEEGDDEEEIIPPAAQPQRTGVRSLFTRFIWLGILIAFTIVALMYYPRVPDYQVCNQQFDWESIFLSLISIQPKIHYDVIISVVNENRFAFDLDYGYANISHRGVKVGTWEISNWTAEAGAISDMMALVKIEPSTYSEAYSLLTDFRANNLTFQIDTNISGYIRWGKYKLSPVSVVAPQVDFLVGDKYPRDLCKCTEYFTPSNLLLR
ncbi:hypothetical protein AC1031_019395 [Aphanomyces cochlioides]|nr:hypothetical protein AC1031_019395 [Aphanomyces cochlioides]